MSHLEYQTPFHPGPYAAAPAAGGGVGPGSGPGPGPSSASTGTGSPLALDPTQFNHSQSSSSQQPQSAPHPDYPGQNQNHSRPPPPHFHDGLMQHQHQQQHQQQHAHNFTPAVSYPGGQQSPYTSAPFAQSVTSTSATPTPPLQQQQQSVLRHSASPQQLNSPYAGPQHHFQQQQAQHLQSQQQTPKQQTPPTRYPMAAPPLPQTPAAVQNPGTSATASPNAPQSPGTQAREQKRVDLLLEINIELLQEINTLQAQGRGGAMNPQHQLQLRQLNMDDSMAAEEYIQCLRRVQANLAYLAPRADVQQAMKAPPGPAHMTPPPHMAHLQPKYEALRELFPGWPGNDARMQNAGSPRTNQMNNPMNGMNPLAAQAQA